MFTANLSSVYELLSIFAKNADTADKLYYPATMELYDYYTDYEIFGRPLQNYSNPDSTSTVKGDGNHRNTYNRNFIFNQALADSGYVSKSGSWSDASLNYYPLYLGWLTDKNDGILGKVSYLMKDSNGNHIDFYNFSKPANSEAGTAVYGSNNTITSGHSAAAQGLVDPVLYNGVLTQGNGAVALPYFDESFLNSKVGDILTQSSLTKSYSGNKGYWTATWYKDSNKEPDLWSKLSDNDSAKNKTLGRVEKGFTFKFLKNADGMYEYDSENQPLAYGSKTYVVGKDSSVSGKTDPDVGGNYKFYKDDNNANGFFPWQYYDNNDYKNFGYAAKFSIPFTMSSDGYTKNVSSGTSGAPIEFNFRGDDDVWVFIDDQLVLDVGGAHGKVGGKVNFGNKGSRKPYAQTYYVKDPTKFHTHNNITTSDVMAGDRVDITSQLDEVGLYSDSTREHTLTVYYIERGTIESNCYISFNFQIADTVSVTNKIDASGVNPAFQTTASNVAASEGMAYLIQSNGGAAKMESPDAGTYTPRELESDFDSEALSATSYKLYFKLDENENIDSSLTMTVENGKTAKLPDYVPLEEINGEYYYVKGWKKYNNSDTTIYTTYKPASNMTFVAEWAKVSEQTSTGGGGGGGTTSESFPDAPRKPTLMINQTNSNLPKMQNYGCTIADGSNNNGTNGCTATFFNATGTATSLPPSNLFFEWSGVRYPGSGQTINLADDNYDLFFLNGSTSSPQVGRDTLVNYLNGDTDENIDNNNSDRHQWIYWYNELYKALDSKYSTVKNLYDGGLRTSLVTNYITTLENYPSLLMSSTSVSSLKSMAQQIRSIGDVTYTYAYTDSDANNEPYDTLTFYVYSEDGAPSVSLTNVPAVGGNVTDVTITQLSQSSAFGNDIPDELTGYVDNNNKAYYYAVTVPATVRKTSTPNDTENYPVLNETIVTKVSVNGCPGVSSTALANSLRTYPYYCYYDYPASSSQTDEWRDIRGATFTFSDEKVRFFVYSRSDPGSVITYFDPMGVEHAPAADSPLTYLGNYLSNYYLYEISETVISSSTGQSGPVGIKIDTVKTYTDDFGTDAAYCFMHDDGSSGNSITSSIKDTWCKLYTVFSASPSNDNYKKLYPFYNNHGYPDHGIDWDHSIQMAQADSTNNWYAFIPYKSGVKYMYHVDSSASWPMTENDVIADKNVSSGGSQTNYVTATNGNSSLYEYTATALAVGSSGSSGSGGNSTPQGQFQAGEGTYADASGVNFKLFNTDTPGEHKAYGIRQTNQEDGKFYLHDNQTAKFTYQFQRHTGLRIAQTGDSRMYTPTYITKLPAETVTITPNSPQGKPEGVMYSATANNEDNGLFTRYRTKWTLTDEAEGRIESSSENYNVYLHGDETGSSLSDDFQDQDYSDVGALYLDNIIKSADETTGIALTATFTNTIITGDLYIKKMLKPDAIDSIESRIALDDGYDPEFSFNVEFYNIFGGNESTDGSARGAYTGTYYIKDAEGFYYGGSDGLTRYKRTYDELEDGVRVHKYKLADSSGNVSGEELSEAEAQVAQTAGDYSMVIQYSQAAKTDGSPAKSGSKVKMLVIEDIPVDTEYVLKEKLPANAANLPIYALESVALYDANKQATAFVLTNNSVGTENYSTEGNEIYGTGYTRDQDSNVTGGKLRIAATPNQKVNEADDAIAGYFAVSRNSINGSDSRLDVVNRLAKGYIIIAKQVNHLYYYAHDENALSDDPAGLFGHTITVGGKPPTSDDVNGHQAATGAEQTFIFRIEEYARNGDDYESSPQNVFYETISFGSGDALNTFKYRIIAVDSSCKYVVTEITDWSWKYSAHTLEINPAVAVQGNSKTGNYKATIIKYGNVTVPEIDQDGNAVSGGDDQEYKNSALVAFTNIKNTDDEQHPHDEDTRDVEGDTSIIENAAPVPAA